MAFLVFKRAFFTVARSILLVLATVSSVSVFAQSSDVSEATVKIKEAFKTVRPDWSIQSVQATPIDGIYKVQIANGPHVYSSASGEYFIAGDLYQVAPAGFVNHTEKERETGRAEQLANISVEDMIVFSPAEKPVKASIMVFTDVDCFYCQKLHQEVPDLNRIGIEVRYLAYPRAGIGSESYKKIASAWCADDQQTAITKLKNRQNIEENVCKDNPVARHFQLGHSIGVNGTPAMVTSDGRLIPGYQPALQLAQTLGVAVDKEIASELLAKMEAQQR